MVLLRGAQSVTKKGVLQMHSTATDTVVPEGIFAGFWSILEWNQYHIDGMIHISEIFCFLKNVNGLNKFIKFIRRIKGKFVSF